MKWYDRPIADLPWWAQVGSFVFFWLITTLAMLGWFWLLGRALS